MKELQNLVKSLSAKEKRMISEHLKVYRPTEEVPKTLVFFNRIFSKKVKYKISYSKQMFQNKKRALLVE